MCLYLQAIIILVTTRVYLYIINYYVSLAYIIKSVIINDCGCFEIGTAIMPIWGSSADKKKNKKITT